MKIDVKVPAVGESVTEATIGSWNKKSGEAVKRNDVLLLLETDKASVEVIAENDGVLTITAQAGEVVKIGATVATIDSDGKATAAPAAETKKTEAPQQHTQSVSAASSEGKPLSPAVQKIVTENNLNTAGMAGTGKDGRLTKGDVLMSLGSNGAAPAVQKTTETTSSKPATPAIQPMFPAGSTTSRQGEKKLVPMTTIRKKIAERLVEAKNTTALLTTFNEVDMTKLNEIRAKYKDKFKEKYGINLGMMGFFTKAVIEALKAFPNVNAYITGTDIEYHNYYNIGIAVSTDRGLMVPVIKDADQMSLFEIENAIRNYALKARDGKIGVDDLNGGTFSITNGGVFGSLMSTPILNAPQSAILGMHKVEDRAVVINGQIVARPMMYLALSYDHRIIDGKESVGFLVKIKEGVEDPERLLIGV
ncbi:MAG: 2-oxoglutarate dehydrogenase complex dihydrolipoyllysine-residue succinyltransferase [Bdellovibrionaceae bacterium]|nr:2-oxoglutarate dehydrogenase complex dihydrolipoyllysine-residue succinyltransferase [Pseudobdellovibrionaceae bacterium]